MKGMKPQKPKELLEHISAQSLKIYEQYAAIRNELKVLEQEIKNGKANMK